MFSPRSGSVESGRGSGGLLDLWSSSESLDFSSLHLSSPSSTSYPSSPSSMSPTSPSLQNKRKRDLPPHPVPYEEAIEKAQRELDALLGLSKMEKRMDLDHPEVRALVEVWQSKRISVYGMEPPDPSHKCTQAGCLNSGYIQTIDRSKSLYGCVLGGLVHLCHRDSTCRTTCLNSDGMRVCTMSATEMAPKMEAFRFTKPDKGFDEEGPDWSGAEDDEDEKELVQEMPMEMTSQDIFDDSLLDGMPIFDSERHSFKGSGGGGGGSDGEDGGKKKKSFFSNKYDRLMAKLKKREDEALHPEKKKVSSSEQKKKKPKQRKCFNLDNWKELETEAQGIVYDLLFNEGLRRRITEPRERIRQEIAEYEVSKFKRRVKRNKVEASEEKEEAIWTEHYDQKKELYPLLKRDETKLHLYVRVCIHLWRAIAKTPYFQENRSNFHFKKHVLGTLYLMSEVLHLHENYPLFPGDAFLFQFLPSRDDLPKFVPSHYANAKERYKINDVTQGTKKIRACFQHINVRDFPEVLEELEQIRKRIQ